MLMTHLAHLLHQTIALAPYASQDGYGNPTYGTAVTYKGRVEMKNHLIRDDLGQERVAKGRVYLRMTTVPSSKDQLTLPADYSPTSPPILSVHPVQGQTGLDHVVLHIG